MYLTFVSFIMLSISQFEIGVITPNIHMITYTIYGIVYNAPTNINSLVLEESYVLYMI